MEVGNSVAVEVGYLPSRRGVIFAAAYCAVEGPGARHGFALRIRIKSGRPAEVHRGSSRKVRKPPEWKTRARQIEVFRCDLPLPAKFSEKSLLSPVVLPCPPPSCGSFISPKQVRSTREYND